MKLRLPYVLAVVALLGVQCFAMKNTKRTFTESCDSVWDSAVNVAKTQSYRIVSISKDDKILSLSAGGVWSGERLISLSLAPGNEGGCTANVQSRFSGLAHSDGPDLLSRIAAELIAQKVDRNSQAFKRYKNCLDAPYTSDSKCEEHLQRDVADETKKASVK